MVKQKHKWIIGIVLAFVLLLSLFRIFCGIFVIQPIGAIPEGATIIYLHSNTNLNLKFVDSADGYLLRAGQGVSLLGRGIILAKVAPIIKENELFRYSYSEWLYLQSTNGVKLNK